MKSLALKKRSTILILIIFFVYIIVVGVICVNQVRLRKPAPFSLKEYEYYLENFPAEETVDPITNPQRAIEEAERIWVEKFGEIIKDSKRPYQVFYDESNEVWLVKHPTQKRMKGGGPGILIEKSGKVLAIWYSK